MVCAVDQWRRNDQLLEMFLRKLRVIQHLAGVIKTWVFWLPMSRPQCSSRAICSWQTNQQEQILIMRFSLWPGTSQAAKRMVVLLE